MSEEKFTIYDGMRALGLATIIFIAGGQVGMRWGVKSVGREPQSAEITDIDRDGIQDIVITNGLNEKRYLLGVKEGEKIIYLSQEQIESRVQEELRKRYTPALEEVKNQK